MYEKDKSNKYDLPDELDNCNSCNVMCFAPLVPKDSNSMGVTTTPRLNTTLRSSLQ